MLQTHRACLIFALFLIAINPLNSLANPEKTEKNTKKINRMATPVLLGASYAGRADVMAWGISVAAERGLKPEGVASALSQARNVPQAQTHMTPAPGGFQKNWRVYRSRFVEPVRLRHGLAFWEQHAQTLLRAQTETGVPAHIIVGILGIETLFGRDMGRFRVLDALTTLAFDFPTKHPRAAERQAFFRDELAQYLALVERSGRSPTELLGSYAGAMGLPQFMPSSWAKHAIDFDGDGKIDLLASPADAIGSVANYLKNFGWQPAMPTHYPAQFSPEQTGADKATLLKPDIVPSFVAADLSAKGMQLGDAAASHNGPLALVELFNGSEPPSYVLGTPNFYAVTRYNWSSYYALAVIEYGEAVEKLRTK